MRHLNCVLISSSLTLLTGCDHLVRQAEHVPSLGLEKLQAYALFLSPKGKEVAHGRIQVPDLSEAVDGRLPCHVFMPPEKSVLSVHENMKSCVLDLQYADLMNPYPLLGNRDAVWDQKDSEYVVDLFPPMGDDYDIVFKLSKDEPNRGIWEIHTVFGVYASGKMRLIEID